MRRVALFIMVGVVTAIGIDWARAALGGGSGVTIPYRGHLELDGTAVSGNVDFTFQIFNDNVTSTPCDSDAINNVPVVGGDFAVVISGIEERCVKSRDVYIGVVINQGGTPVTLAGRQKVAPALSSLTSGTGDFHVAGALVGVDGGPVSGPAMNLTGTGGNTPHECIVRAGGGVYQTFCQAGEVAVGGGGRCGIGNYPIYENFPVGPGGAQLATGSKATGWRVVCAWNDGMASTEPLIWVVCCKE